MSTLTKEKSTGIPEPFGYGSCCNTPPRLADGFGHAQLPYSLLTPDLLVQAESKFTPINWFPRFPVEIRLVLFFSLIFISFSFHLYELDYKLKYR